MRGRYRYHRLPAMIVAAACLLFAAAPAPAQFGTQPPDALGSGPGQPDDQPVVTMSAQFTKPTAEKPSELFITARIKAGWHIYSITQPIAGPGGGGPVRSRIKLVEGDQYKVPGAFQAAPPPDKKKEAVFDNLVVETHHGTVVWHAPIELAAGVDPEKLKIAGRLFAQPCDADSCLKPQHFPFTATLGPGVVLPKEKPKEKPEEKPQEKPSPAEKPATPPKAPKAENRAQGSGELAWRPFTTVAAFKALTGFDADKTKEYAEKELSTISVWHLLGYVWWGLLGGLILNVMPCVLPVIGLKIFSFVEQSGHDRGKAFLLNVWYSAGLLSVFVLLAALAVVFGYGWGQLFSFKEFNITLAAVVFVMALSFLGVWELPIPGFAGSGKATELASHEGATGAFAKGVLTTILATPCGAPLLAPAVAWGIAQPPLVTFTVFVSAGIGMASPYLLIGAFPELIRFLPKPGAWMETFKQLMGFVLLGTVVFILTFVPWPYVVPTVGLLFGLWVACWWIGRMPVTADSGRRARTWLAAVTMGGVAWLVTFPGFSRVLPERFAVGGLAAMMQGRFQRDVDSAVALQMASKPGEQTVLVDFTADWCMTCKYLEARVLNSRAVREAVERNNVVTVQADWTHGAPEVTRMLELLGSKQVPVVAIFPANNPNEPTIFRGGFTSDMVIDALDKAGAAKPGSEKSPAPGQPSAEASQVTAGETALPQKPL